MEDDLLLKIPKTKIKQKQQKKEARSVKPKIVF